MGDARDNAGGPEGPGDALSEAQRALSDARWHDAADAAQRAVRDARTSERFDALADASELAARAHERIHAAAVEASGEGALIAARDTDLPDPVPPGCYLLQPPMVGADAARFRALAREARVPVVVLAREPLTRASRWPVVSVGDVILRVRVEPPRGVQRVAGRMTGDDYPGPAPLGWFLAAHARLGDAALERIDPDEHPHHRVDDLLEFASALPDHAGIARALAETAREAVGVARPTMPRSRPVIDDPFSF